MGFISILKKIGGVSEVAGKDILKISVPAISTASEIYPPLGPVAALLSGVARMVPAAHETELNNIDKKSLVLTMVESLTPVFVEMLVDKTGKTVTDEARFTKAVDSLVENVLDLYKSIGAIPVTVKSDVRTQTA